MNNYISPSLVFDSSQYNYVPVQKVIVPINNALQRQNTINAPIILSTIKLLLNKENLQPGVLKENSNVSSEVLNVDNKVNLISDPVYNYENSEIVTTNNESSSSSNKEEDHAVIVCNICKRAFVNSIYFDDHLIIHKNITLKEFWENFDPNF